MRFKGKTDRVEGNRAKTDVFHMVLLPFWEPVAFVAQ